MIIGLIGSALLAHSGCLVSGSTSSQAHSYSIGDKSTGIWYLSLARLLQGIWIGSSALICQIYTAEVLTKE